MMITNKTDAYQFALTWLCKAPITRAKTHLTMAIESQERVLGIMRSSGRRYSDSDIMDRHDAVGVLRRARMVANGQLTLERFKGFAQGNHNADH